MIMDKVFTNHNIQKIVTHYYLEYTLNIQCRKFSINGREITWKRLPEVDGKDATFFHLITIGYDKRNTYCCPDNEIVCTKDFEYDPMMDNKYSELRTICGNRILHLDKIVTTFQKTDNLIWEKTSTGRGGRKRRIHILNQEHKYHIILQLNRDGVILFWTAYPVTSSYLSELKKDYYRHRNKTTYILQVK